MCSLTLLVKKNLKGRHWALKAQVMTWMKLIIGTALIVALININDKEQCADASVREEE